jgi:hypothetical protein
MLQSVVPEEGESVQVCADLSEKAQAEKGLPRKCLRKLCLRTAPRYYLCSSESRFYAHNKILSTNSYLFPRRTLHITINPTTHVLNPTWTAMTSPLRPFPSSTRTRRSLSPPPTTEPRSSAFRLINSLAINLHPGTAASTSNTINKPARPPIRRFHLPRPSLPLRPSPLLGTGPSGS